MNVVVLGGGIMGSGIGQLAATAGHAVTVRDIEETTLRRARDATSVSLTKLVSKQRLDEELAEGARERLTFTTDLDAVGEADVVIEAVPEILELKRSLFREAVALAPPSALLGTNTSQLSITAIGSAIGEDAARLVGMHFFNPPVLMRLIELVRGLQTSDDTLEGARDFAEGLGKEVVVCRKDSPGFLTSRISAILRLECIRMLEEGLADAEDIDKAMRLGFNHPMGPLELGDFNGHDTFLHVLESLEHLLGERFRPPVTIRNMVEAGQLGRKTGVGFYDYPEDGR